MRYEHPAPGDLPQFDVKKLGRIPEGGGQRVRGRSSETRRIRGPGLDDLHVAIDEHSRYAYAEALTMSAASAPPASLEWPTPRPTASTMSGYTHSHTGSTATITIDQGRRRRGRSASHL